MPCFDFELGYVRELRPVLPVLESEADLMDSTKMLNLVIMLALVCQGSRDVLILETSSFPLGCIIHNAAAPSHCSTAALSF